MSERGRGRGGPRGGGGDRGGRGGFSDRGGRGRAFSDRGGRGGSYDRGGAGRGGFVDRGGKSGGRGGGGRGGGGPKGIYREGEIVPQPNTEITKFENETINDPANAMGALTLEESLPRRPAYCTEGKAVVLRTNFFEITLNNPKQELFNYQLDISSDESLSKKKTRRYVELFLNQGLFKEVGAASDYGHRIITNKKLDLGSTGRATFKITIHDRYEAPFPTALPNEDEGRKKARKRRERILKLYLLKTYSVQEIFKYVRAVSPGGSYDSKGDLTTFLNLIFARAPNLEANISNVGQNKFFPFHHLFGSHANYESMDMGSGLLALRGYYSSVRLGPQRVLLNLNVASAAFYEPGPLHTLMNKFIGHQNRTNRRVLQDLSSFIKGLKVITKYASEKDASGQAVQVNKVKAVFGLALAPTLGANSQQVSFLWERDSGAKVTTTVEQYFQQKYGQKLNSPGAPLVNCGTRNDPQLVPPELCYVVGGQPARRALSPEETASMITFAARFPNLNAASIEGTGLHVMSATQDRQAMTIGQFGLSVGTQMLTVPGRILAAPSINFKKPFATREGSWNLANQQFTRGAVLKGIFTGFQILEGSRSPKTQNFQQCMDTIASEFRKYGITMQNRKPPLAPLNLPVLGKEFIDKIKVAMDAKFADMAKKDVRWCLIALPSFNKVLYSVIKLYGDVKYGIQTVLIKDDNCRKIVPMSTDFRPDLMLVGNLALKFCAKAGGQAWSVAQKDLKLIDNDTMVVGIDVTHPSPDSQSKAPSIAAIVASFDKNLSAWLADLRIQTSRMEMVEGLTEMVKGRLEVFRKKNEGRLPKKVLIYRDGVSEGQFPIVLNTEYPSIVKAFEAIYGSLPKHPKVSIIIVGKRHHTRFYPTARDHADINSRDPSKGSYNTAPGTVVDRHITGYGDKVWDFYLQPHKALQGTARAAHYIVIKNEIGFNAADLEKTAHGMCYGYHRATKAVSIATPAYYADRVAERGAQYLYSTMHENVGSEASFNVKTADWTSGVHANIADSQFWV